MVVSGELQGSSLVLLPELVGLRGGEGHHKRKEFPRGFHVRHQVVLQTPLAHQDQDFRGDPQSAAGYCRPTRDVS